MPTSDEIRIELATADDAQQLAAVYLDGAEHHVRIDPEFYQVPDARAIARSFSERLESPDRAIFVARANGAIVGSVDIAILRPGDRPGMVRPVVTADVGIAVLAAYRHRGIGRRLMEAAEDWARARGATRMTLNCHAANADAVTFYASLGYSTTGLFMAKRLPATDRAPGHDAAGGPRS